MAVNNKIQAHNKADELVSCMYTSGVTNYLQTGTKCHKGKPFV